MNKQNSKKEKSESTEWSNTTSVKDLAARRICGPRFAFFKGLDESGLVDACKTNNDAIMVFIFHHKLENLLKTGRKWFSSLYYKLDAWDDYFQIIALKVYSDKFINMFKGDTPTAYLVRSLNNIASDIHDQYCGTKRKVDADGNRVATHVVRPFSAMSHTVETDCPYAVYVTQVYNPNYGETNEVVDVVNKTLASCGPENAFIFRMHIDGYKTEEIVESLKKVEKYSSLEISENAVRARIHRTKMKIRENLDRGGLLVAA